MSNEWCLEILFDNGVKEYFYSGQLDKEDFFRCISIMEYSMKTGTPDFIELVNEQGRISSINTKKVVRFSQV